PPTHRPRLSSVHELLAAAHRPGEHDARRAKDLYSGKPRTTRPHRRRKRMSPSTQARVRGVTRRSVAKGLRAGIVATVAPFNIAKSQGAGLKVGVLLPRSGVQTGIGQDCQRGVEIAAGILKDIGLPTLSVMNGDTESNVEVSRSRAERLIS